MWSFSLSTSGIDECAHIFTSPRTQHAAGMFSNNQVRLSFEAKMNNVCCLKIYAFFLSVLMLAIRIGSVFHLNIFAYKTSQIMSDFLDLFSP